MKKIAVLISNKGTGSNLQAIIDNCKTGKMKLHGLTPVVSSPPSVERNPPKQKMDIHPVRFNRIGLLRRRIKGEIAVVVSDKADAYGLVRAKKHRIPAVVRPFTKFKDKKARNEYGKRLAKELKEKYQVDLVVLAGWMIILPASFIKYFPLKIVNLHPGLIADKKGSRLKLSDGSYAKSFEGEFTNGAIRSVLESGISISGSSTHFVTPEADWGPVIMRAEEKIRKNDTIDSYYSRLKKKEHLILPLSVKLFCEDKLKVRNNKVKILDKRYKKHRT